MKETESIPEKSLVLRFIIMGDPMWLCLFEADFSDRNNIKGNLRVKINVADIQEVNFDKVEQKKLNLVLLFEGKIVRPSLIFDSP